MSFIAIVLSWLAVQYWGSGGPVQRDGFWFTGYRLFSSIPWAAIRLGLLILPPMALLVYGFQVLAPLSFGLPAFALSLLLLLYSLGRGDLQADLKHYLGEWEQGDVQGAYHRACRLSADFQEEIIEDAAGLHEQVRKVLFYRGLERWFVPVFWFALLSYWPWAVVAAVLYRVVHLLAHSPKLRAEDRRQCQELMELMEWLPARLLALSFALTGRFESAFRSWRHESLSQHSHEEYLAQVGCAALEEGPAQGLIDGEAYWQQCTQQLLAIQRMLTRCLVVWILVFSLIEIL